MSSVETCHAVRVHWDVPVIMISAKNLSKDRIESCQAGADQYVAKPFDIDELVCRNHTFTQRAGTQPHVIRMGGIEIDFESHEVKRDGSSTIHLTAKELSYCAT